MQYSTGTYLRLFKWWHRHTRRIPKDLDEAVTAIWWLQTGMGVALKHPEYAQMWLAMDPGRTWDFPHFADSFVQEMPIEARLE